MNQDAALRGTIVDLGVELGPVVLQRSQALYATEQGRLATGFEPTARDVAYGSHSRQRLDLYAPRGSVASGSAPVLVWVHGGGFVRGEKYSHDDPFNAHVGRWAAREGFLGVVMNYRLAPECAWPAGGEDVGAVVAWLKANAATHGGDPERVVLMGTSAGSVHIATYLQLQPGARQASGAVLLSGLYGATPLEATDRRYFGDDERLHPQRAALSAVASSGMPLFVACAEFDPPRFQAETLALLQAVHRAQGKLPRVHFACGHNHYTLALHLGSTDTRLTDEVLSFARECCSRGTEG